MSSSEATTIPQWRRPVRIPENVAVERADPPVALAGETAAWTLRFRLDRDVRPGAALKLQLFGGRNNKGKFEAPQTDSPDKNAYVTARTADGRPVALQVTDDPGTLGVTVPEPGLGAGDELLVTLGDRSGGGDGITAPDVRQLGKFFVLYDPDDTAGGGAKPLPEWALSGGKSNPAAKSRLGAIWSELNEHHVVGACSMHILGGALDHLRAYAPSQIRPGERFAILVRPEDERSNLSHEALDGLAVLLDGEELQADLERVPESTCVRLNVRVENEGVHRLVVRDRRTGKEAATNPAVCSVSPRGHNVYWGMIHGHSEMSDGAGSLEDYFRQIRDEAALDFAAPADHDHLWETAEPLWRMTCETVARWNRPGEFVTLLGYEWAKWTRKGHGDRNVYYLEDHRPMYRSDESNFPAPPDLFKAIQGETAIVIPHHTGHSGNFCDFKDHDPERERLVEIFQLRGSYEREDDNPIPERRDTPPMDCGYVSRALAMGWRVGFTAGGDDHIGHAGTEFPIPDGQTAYKAGLMAVLATERTREAVWDAMWNRRVIATTGPRILLDYELNGSPMGSELDATSSPGLAERRELRIEFHGTACADRIDIVRNNEIVETVCPAAPDCELSWQDTSPLDEVLLPPAKFCANPFCFYYVRVIQSDGEVAWASPVWIDAGT